MEEGIDNELAVLLYQVIDVSENTTGCRLVLMHVRPGHPSTHHILPGLHVPLFVK